MREIAAADVSITYAQLCVFDPAMDQPFNDWTSRHVTQGFAWRPGSASFRVGDNFGSVHVTVSHAEEPPSVEGAHTAIRVPFHVPSTGQLEIASIGDGFETFAPPGACDLYFLMSEATVSLVVTPSRFGGAEVLKPSELASGQDVYLMEADPA